MNTDLISNNIHKNKPAREKKGQSLLTIKSDYTIIDIEATGYDAKFDSIIEISAIKVRNNKIIDKFDSLVNPLFEIDEYVIELTGITNEMLINAQTIDVVANNFLNFIENDILVGHNVNFDINFLYDACLETNNKYLSNDFIDTLRISRKINKNLNHHRLDDLLEYYKIGSRDKHRALNDCELTYQVFLNMQDKIFEVYNTIENFECEIKKGIRNRKNTLHASDISANCEFINDENPFYKKEVVFTGTLEKMIRKDAMQIIANLGGFNSDNVRKSTSYLVLGNYDYLKSIKDGKSNKYKKAEKLKLQGQDIEIISENVFFDMVNDYI